MAGRWRWAIDRGWGFAGIPLYGATVGKESGDVENDA
jgi:hypothetical protein